MPLHTVTRAELHAKIAEWERTGHKVGSIIPDGPGVFLVFVDVDPSIAIRHIPAEGETA